VVKATLVRWAGCNPPVIANTLFLGVYLRLPMFFQS